MSDTIETFFSPKSDLPFWELVSQLGWGSETTDYRALRRRVGAVSTAEERAGLRSTFRALNEVLKQVIYAWEEQSGINVGLGNDGRADLHSHIVGLGLDEYIRVLRDPQLAYHRATRRDFVESFFYVFLDPAGT